MEIVIKFKNWIIEFVIVINFSLIMTRLFCRHPLTLCLTLVLLAARVGVLRGIVYIKWIFYATVLIFLGGIIVVFIYVTTLAGNEKFQISLINPAFLVLILRLISIYVCSPKLSIFKKETFIRHIYYTRSAPILCFLIIFLFRVLILVIKLAENFKGALIKFL